jgi:hypothetical protein
MQGAALPIAMIFLFLITLTGVSMLDTSVDNQKMTNNYHHRTLSNQASDSALYMLLTMSADDVGPGYTNAFESDLHADLRSVPKQPDMNVDLEMEFIEERKNVFVPGFEIGSSAYIYEARSTGSVGTASVTNNMGVALIRPPTK